MIYLTVNIKSVLCKSIEQFLTTEINNLVLLVMCLVMQHLNMQLDHLHALHTVYLRLKTAWTLWISGHEFLAQ